MKEKLCWLDQEISMANGYGDMKIYQDIRRG